MPSQISQSWKDKYKTQAVSAGKTGSPDSLP